MKKIYFLFLFALFINCKGPDKPQTPVKSNDMEKPFAKTITAEDLIDIYKEFLTDTAKDSIFEPYGFENDYDGFYLKKGGFSTFKYSHEYFMANTEPFLTYRLLSKKRMTLLKNELDSLYEHQTINGSSTKYLINEDFDLELYFNKNAAMNSNERHEIIFSPFK